MPEPAETVQPLEKTTVHVHDGVQSAIIEFEGDKISVLQDGGWPAARLLQGLSVGRVQGEDRWLTYNTVEKIAREVMLRWQIQYAGDPKRLVVEVTRGPEYARRLIAPLFWDGPHEDPHPNP